MEKKNRIMTVITVALGIAFLPACSSGVSSSDQRPIDREALLERNSPVVTAFDSLASLTVGNGDFAFTVDATGLQTFPVEYAPGVPLGTQSSWGWHSWDNPKGFTIEDTYVEYDFGHGQKELYTTKNKENARAMEAYNYFRENPHRLHLGNIGFCLSEGTTYASFSDIRQKLDLEEGVIESEFKLGSQKVEVETACNPKADQIAVKVECEESPLPIVIAMPYPTGKHADNACDWKDDKTLHYTYDTLKNAKRLELTHWFPKAVVAEELSAAEVHDYTYGVAIEWSGETEMKIERKGDNRIVLYPSTKDYAFTAWFYPIGDKARVAEYDDRRQEPMDAERVFAASEDYWKNYWWKGAMVDLSGTATEGARELERRIVLSQYLLAVNSAGSVPPQETGLTYNSWFGKYHMEMIWWHQAQFALWGHPEKLDHTLRWYKHVEPVARLIARRQGFKGVRWMKMTDPSGTEAPSNVGSFLIWQQPHIIYLAELLYRAASAQEARGDYSLKANDVLDRYYDLVQATAEFMFDFADYDEMGGRYVLKGAIPAQETLKASETQNSPFELSQWHYCMGVAQQWRERKGLQRNMEWEELIDKLSPLTYISETDEDLTTDEKAYIAKYGKLYLAAETARDTYRDVRYTSDHMAVLGALGIFPKTPQVRNDVMANTLHWVWDNWNWGKTWGWDYPMTSMCAARLGEKQIAVDALVVPKRTNTYLISGHNYQDSRLRLYLPGNGGLLTAVAALCAGWDGCDEKNPGFPEGWNVKWEGLQPLP